MTLQQLLEQFQKDSANTVEQGRKFEMLVKNYLLSAPLYKAQIKKVFAWADFFGKEDFGSGADVGIDLVAETFFGEYWAIQCKFFTGTTRVDKADVDSFLTTSARTFRDADLSKKIGFSSRLLFIANGNLTDHAREATNNSVPPCVIISGNDMSHANLDWAALARGINGSEARLKGKQPRPHQIEAREKTLAHFAENDRGQLIMACGTGKTYTALQIAESLVKPEGAILFLVPSIALLGQSLREWANDAKRPIRAVCICSDANVVGAANRRNNAAEEDRDSTLVSELAFPASTNVDQVVKQFRRQAGLEYQGGLILSEPDQDDAQEPMLVVFSTYQSIEVISKAQKVLLEQGVKSAHFEAIICDEAHRTTGVTLAGEDESAFVKVHDNDFIKAKKRLYMTATPKLYAESSRKNAEEVDATLCSMDDPAVYGQEIYRIGFGNAVELGLLTDYKVLVMTISEDSIPPELQRSMSNENGEIKTDDASYLIGCINALSKQVIGQATESFGADDTAPMKRAVAFCQSIKASKHISNILNNNADRYADTTTEDRREKLVKMRVKHIDGGMSASERDELLDWLKAEPEHEKDCKMLTNVRCLSEGVDVPSLDAVIFLSPRSSQVDVVQSVGRVMRKSDGKKYGYIIIPVFVPTTVDAASALDKNTRFKVVWSVLNALRAHDDRFNAIINKIELNKQRPSQIAVGAAPLAQQRILDQAIADGIVKVEDLKKPDIKSAPASGLVGGKPAYEAEAELDRKTAQLAQQFSISFGKLQQAIFGKLVEKVGDRLYWENWAKDIATIAENQVAIITQMVAAQENREAFEAFMQSLHHNINPAISEKEAIEMLAQHRITKPVFEALFDGYSFAQNNPISVAMEGMLTILQEHGSAQDLEKLEAFYKSVRRRAEGIDNAAGKQSVIIELYDKFFKNAFPKLVEKLGIVYTPVEVVDFIIHSVDEVLKEHFGRGIGGENVRILDPFTGTGTFMTRLIQSGLISRDQLPHKYKHELFANELVLLAYYIAAVNIENAYHDVMATGQYEPFEGICLTDTFQLGETGAQPSFLKEMFPANSERVKRQKSKPLTVIMGNPPYSVGQDSANDNAQNQSYPLLERRIAETYARLTDATNKNSLYDSYIKAFRWASDRLGEDGGVIAFVSNGGWLDGNSANGLRRTLEKEFSFIYIFNLRGNARTSGEQRRREKDNVFGVGTRTPVSITLLIKKPKNLGTAEIHYADIGDYLSREDKFKIIRTARHIKGEGLNWQLITPDEKGDWINQTDGEFDSFIPLIPEEKFAKEANSFFIAYSRGVATSRDAYVFASNLETLYFKINNAIAFYNSELQLAKENSNYEPKINASIFVWTDNQKSDFEARRIYKYENGKIVSSQYRPFNKQYLYFGKQLNTRTYQIPKLFPTPAHENLVICMSLGAQKGMPPLITNLVPDLHLIGDAQCFPLYYYEADKTPKYGTLFDKGLDEPRYIQQSAIAPFILKQCKERYGKTVSPEDVFYFVYGFLHDPVYRLTYENDLKKSLPRIPLPDKFERFAQLSQLGRELAALHLNYENQPKPEGVNIVNTMIADAQGNRKGNYRVDKIRYSSKTDRSIIWYNEHIMISGIPTEVYDYVVNGKSAIDWIIERYQVHTHKESGIINDANDWCDEVQNERYILDLLLSVMTVSLETQRLVKACFGR